MLVLKGFIPHSQFVNNQADTIAPFGELSTEAATYARDVGQYISDASPNLTLHSFFCKQDGVATTIPPALVAHVLAVAKYVYSNTLNNSGEVFSDVLLENLFADFATSGEAFTCGEMVTDGQYYVPEWLAWKAKNIAGVDSNELRIWFADENFRLQYDEFEITVVPPTDVLDNFFKTGTEVDLMLSSLTIKTMVARMQDASNGKPYTIMTDATYDYVDPLFPSHRVPSNWGLLIYGAAGNNVDSISDALIDYILGHSTHTREEWSQILPDLFRRTECLIIPSWFQYAISPRMTQPGGVYSPVLSINKIVARVKELAPAYTDAHINENTTVMGHPYNSLSLIVVGSPDNREGKFKITDFYPDYLSVPTASQDYNRMAQATKDWLDILQRQLVEAEKMTEFSSVPHGMTRSKRNGTIYLVTNVGNVNFLMAVRANYADEFVPAQGG